MNHPASPTRSTLRNARSGLYAFEDPGSSGTPQGSGPRLSVRARILAAALLLSTLPLIVASIILPTQVARTLQKAGHDYLALMAKDLAALTQKELSWNLEVVRSFAKVDTLQTATRHYNEGTLTPAEQAATRRQLEALLSQLAGSSYQSIFMCGADGRAFAGMLAAPKHAPYPDINLRDRSYFQEARSTLQPVISDPILSRVNDVPVIAVVAPLLDDHGTFAGTIGLAIKIEHLSALISDQRIGNTGYPFAIDKQGIIFAHPDPSRRFNLALGDIAGAEHLAGRMLKGETGTAQYVSSLGAKKVAAFTPVPITGWSIAASIETDEFLAPARRLRWAIFAMIGACVVVAVTVAISFSIGLEELKTALANARRNETELNVIHSHVPVMIFLLDSAGKVRRANRAAQTLAACSEAEALGRTTGDLLGCIHCLDDSHGCGFGPDCITCKLNTRATAIRCTSPAPSRVEARLRLIRGHETKEFVLASSTATLQLDGETMSLLCLEDITHQKQAEERVHDQAALLNVTQDAIFVLDLDGQITFWNRGAEHVFGWAATDALGQPLKAMFTARAEQDSYAAAIQAAWKQGEWSGEVRHHNRAGRALILQSRASLVRGAGNDPRAVLVVNTDVTEEKQMETQLLRAQRLDSLGALASGVAHDLNNVLSPILISAELLRPLAIKPEDIDMLRVLSDSANRGAGIVRQLLLFGRGSTEPRTSIELHATLTEIERVVQRTFPKNISIRVDNKAGPTRVLADATQLQQVFLNLCVNARDAMCGGGNLIIALSRVEIGDELARAHPGTKTGTYALITVSDTGTGIPSSILDKIFDPFFTTKPPESGTGLGLSTVIGIVKSHGGFITVSSSVGVGTEFGIYLPTADCGDGPSGQSTSPTGSWDGHGDLILLVDDDHAIRAILRRTLENANYRVLLAHDGAEALRLYGGNGSAVCAAIVDMIMPNMAGQETIDGLRLLSASVPIIALSGSPDLHRRVRELDRVGVSFLAKPFSSPALLSLLQQKVRDRTSG